MQISQKYFKIVAWSSVLALFAGLSLYFSRSHPQESATRLAPEFSLPDESGKTVRLSDFKGKSAVFVHFWATWCPPCLPEIPEVIRFSSWARAHGIQVIAISLDESWEIARTVLKASADLISLLDLEKKVPEAYGSYQYPESYLVSAEGQVLFKWVGAQEWSSKAVQADLTRLLARPAP